MRFLMGFSVLPKAVSPPTPRTPPLASPLPKWLHSQQMATDLAEW